MNDKDAHEQLCSLVSHIQSELGAIHDFAQMADDLLVRGDRGDGTCGRVLRLTEIIVKRTAALMDRAVTPRGH